MNPVKYPYFAYGSNLSIHQMSKRCPGAIPIGWAELQQHRLEFRTNSKGRGVATVVPDFKSVVPGGIWLITSQDLAKLDRFEGYPNLYTRISLPVTYNQYWTTDVIVYIMTPGHRLVPPQNDYLDIIRNGYDDFGLDKGLLDIAVKSTKTRSGRGRKPKRGPGIISIFN